MLEGMDLWCAVYDGAVWWEGRDAFEQIEYLSKKLRRANEKLDWAVQELLRCDNAEFARHIAETLSCP
jgi:hypothetical protein